MQRILIADDMQPVHALIRARLKDLGVEMHSVYDGSAAVEAAATVEPDLILLDIDMPECDGFEACRRLKDNPLTHDIPVIFITGASGSLDKVKGFELGALDYVVKPFDPTELRARVRSALHLKQMMDLLTEQAQIDHLTGLNNRRSFDQHLDRELAAARRAGRMVGLVLVDVDHFKRINDSHGHPCGDQVLRRIGELLQQHARAGDVVCRYGGEEFSVILPDASLDQACHCGARLHQAIRNDPQLQKLLGHRVTVSVGVACSAHMDPVDDEQMVVAVDAALYAAKDNGRDRVMMHRRSGDYAAVA